MDKRLQHLERAFRALADPTRLRIVGLLADGEVCVCRIYEALRIPQPKASRHLAYLRHAGLVDARRDGLWIYYKLAAPADGSVRTVLNAALHTLSHVATTRVDEERLRKKVRRPVVERTGLPILACCHVDRADQDDETTAADQNREVKGSATIRRRGLPTDPPRRKVLQRLSDTGR